MSKVEKNVEESINLVVTGFQNSNVNEWQQNSNASSSEEEYVPNISSVLQ